MIYIADGMSCAGKTTYINSLGLPVKKLALDTLEEVINELENNDNIAYDRLINVYYISADEATKINEYLSTKENVDCKLFICDLEKGWERVVASGKRIFRKKYESTYSACNYIKDFLPKYSVVNIDA